MSPSWQSLRVSPSVAQRNAVRGFTLLETLLSFVVIVLAVVLLFFVVARMQQQARIQRWGEELTRFAAVFTDYRARNGRWPDTTKEIARQLETQGWSRGSPFGGEYNWKPPTEPGQPGLILLTAFHPGFPLTLTREELAEVDRQLDDGNLKTGRLRTGFNGWPVYQVREKP